MKVYMFDIPASGRTEPGYAGSMNFAHAFMTEYDREQLSSYWWDITTREIVQAHFLGLGPGRYDVNGIFADLEMRNESIEDDTQYIHVIEVR